MTERVKTKKKLKTEHLLIILLVAVVAVAFIFGGNLSGLFKSGSDPSSSSSDTEKRLENLIQNVSGAGKSKVLITYAEKSRVEVAKDVVKTESGGVTTVKETVVMVGGKPYVINEYLPTVEGVIIVCEGADDVKVRMQVTDAVVTALNVSADKIKILKMK